MKFPTFGYRDEGYYTNYEAGLNGGRPAKQPPGHLRFGIASSLSA